MKSRDVNQTTVPLPPSPDAGAPASWVEKSAGVCGGDARIRKTRVTVWGLVERRNQGLSDPAILEHLPDLVEADLDAAWDYYAQHPEEIDQAIDDEEAA